MCSRKRFSISPRENLELVFIDFPLNKPIDEEVEIANRALAEQYDIEGFPTVLVLDVDGTVVHREEELDNKNATAYTADLKKALNK